MTQNILTQYAVLWRSRKKHGLRDAFLTLLLKSRQRDTAIAIAQNRNIPHIIMEQNSAES